jgi:NAD(P)-dependent dehydrogenase (short-subunit alcohol dehydrogenase family)
MDKNAVVLISGCSSGIGLSLAREFASRGCKVFATARKLSVIENLKKEGMETAALDVTDQKSIDSCVAEVMAKTGRIDVMVNNAGFVLVGPVIDLLMDDLRLQFETNVIGHIALIKACAPHMIKRGSGLIVNIASVSGICATPFAGAYCGSKAAVNLLSDSLRMELAPFGISVITVQPGAIESSLGDNAAKNVDKYAHSVYAPIVDYIRRRAYASQKDATSTAEFSKTLVDKLFLPKIPKRIRIGHQSTLLPLLVRLPGNILDNMMTKTFGLNKLKKK